MSVFVRAAQRQKKLLRVSVKFISYIFSQRINDLFTTPQVCCIVLLEENLLGRFIKRSVFRSHHTFSSLENHQKRNMSALWKSSEAPISFYVFYKNLSTSLRRTKCPFLYVKFR